MSDDERDDEAFELAREVKFESMALQAICSVLLAEIALLHDDSHAKLDHMATSLRGMAHGLALNVSEPILTATVDQVCSMAESVLVAPRSPS